MKRHHLSFQVDSRIRRIIELLIEGGATDCFFVGGFVRDLILGEPSKDIDIEIYGLSYQKIIRILRPHFRVGLVGQSFGTVKVDNEIDLSIPRTESKIGGGHKGFSVSSDPNLDPLTAFSRRDFTVNAIGLRLDGSVFDPFGGIEDLERRILRAPTEAFCEDPLRVLRAMQFAARFDMEMEPETVELCRRVLPEFPTLSPDRIWMEWAKWASKGRMPGKGLRLLRQTGWIECFPEIAMLVDVPQNPKYHPEGDVFEHTTLVCDSAARIAKELQFDQEDRTILLFAALCHDFGKPCTTIRNKKGNWSSPRHAIEGVGIAAAFLEKMRAPNRIVDHVKPLVREHLAHHADETTGPPPLSNVRRLASRLEPSNIRMWSALCRADALGNGNKDPRYRIDTWEAVAEKLAIRESKPKALLLGRDLIALGVRPGREMGRILQDAYEAQLDGRFETFDEALDWVRSELDMKKRQPET